jgi:outer membrane protein assembly factor BamB
VRAVPLLACLLALAAAAPAAAMDWLRFDGDSARSGFAPGSGITRADLPHLEEQRVALPGTVDSAPIYLSNVTVAGAKRDVFVVTTSYGRTLALDADTGAKLWQFAPQGIQSWEGVFNRYTTATPVADPQKRFVYAPAPDGRIHKLAVADGTEIRTSRWPAPVTLMPKSEKLSASLNLADDRLIVTTASFQDRFPYQGHVVVIDRDSGKRRGVFNVLCANKHHLLKRHECKHNTGGVWGRGGAVVEPGSGRLLFASGNAGLNGRDSWGNSLLELTPDAHRLLRAWNPPDYRRRQVHDGDFGSTSPALIRYRKRLLAIEASKDHSITLLDVRRMRRHGKLGHMPGRLQTIRIKAAVPFVASPAVWQKRRLVFFAHAGGTYAYRLGGARKPRLRRVWRTSTPGTSPLVAGGLLYVYDFVHGKLVVREPGTGKRLARRSLDTGHWNSPVVADARIALAAGDARLSATTGALWIWRKP